jgi:hypothetical protein
MHHRRLRGVQPRDRGTRFSIAGHLPPRAAWILDDGHAIALGVRADWPRPEAHVTVPAHATLLLYTDGLVERRRSALEHGISRAAARRSPLPAANPHDWSSNSGRAVDAVNTFCVFAGSFAVLSLCFA